MTQENILENKLKAPLAVQETIGSRVRWKRKKMGMLSKELAAKCDVPPSSINMLEMDRVGQPRYLKKLADELKVTTDYLLYGDAENNIEGSSTLISVSAPLQPNFETSDYYVVKIAKGKKPFYADDMEQVGMINEVFVAHKK
mgnify:FL=1|jgi:transcriptional regulator with XRE-family HTH domain|tara:strand:- start:199 stop:624 length:426 start_codon:yes stop_codon:yes gene_type:complete